MRLDVLSIIHLFLCVFYLGDNDDDCYDGGWIDELADDERLVDSNCESSHFGNDEVASLSVYFFLVDGKNHSQCPITKHPH